MIQFIYNHNIICERAGAKTDFLKKNSASSKQHFFFYKPVLLLPLACKDKNLGFLHPNRFLI